MVLSFDEDGNLTENCEKISDIVEEIAPDLTVSPAEIYVNPAFIRYITGEDHQ